MRYQSPQKHHPPSFLSPPKSADDPSPPLFRQTPSILFFCEPPPLKSDFSVNSQNIKTCSSLIPSYLLKVTKSFGENPQFELLVMTEKNIFACKLFLLLNISDFNFLCVKIASPP